MQKISANESLKLHRRIEMVHFFTLIRIYNIITRLHVKKTFSLGNNFIYLTNKAKEKGGRWFG